jgi:hypothetical protein
MVKRLLLLLLIIVPLALSLTTCDLFVAVFSMSPFPGYLSQAVASVYMGHDIEKFLGDDYADWQSEVYVLRNSTSEYVFLRVQRNPGGQIVYAFDTSLNMEVSETVSEQNRLHLVEADTGDFVVGRVIFSGDPLTASSPYPASNIDAWGKQMFAHSMNNYILWSDFDGSDSHLWAIRYNTGWGETGNASTVIETGADRRLVGLGYEPDTANFGDPVLGAGITPVYLFIHGRSDDGGREERFLYIVRSDADAYTGSLVAAPADLITGSPAGYVSEKIDNMDDEFPVFYTRKGIVAGTDRRGTFQLLKLNGQKIKSFYITKNDRVSMDFDIDGEYYYLFDEQTMRLYKAATGF